MRARALLLPAALLTALLSGCTSQPTPSPASTDASTAATGSAAADPEAIRAVDFGEREWLWDTQGTVFPVTLHAGTASADDPHYQQTAQFTIGEAVYSDANGDGLTDAAVSVTWELSNGIATNWFLWLAQEDAPADPQQIPFPIASGARCGDGVAGVEAIDGGFRVNEVMRSSLERQNACAEAGTMARSREVMAAGDGTGAGSWPVTMDGEGFGGYCPVKEYTEGSFAPAQGQVGPSEDAPATSATGDKLYSPLQYYPFHQPEGWRLTGFLPEEQVDDSVICVWVRA